MMFKKKMLYKDWIYEWLQEKKNYIKESTYANYSNSIFNHIIPKLGNYYVKDLNNKIIQNFILELYNNGKINSTGGLSEKSIKDITIIVKGSIKKAINEKLVDHFELSFNYPKNYNDIDSESKIYILSKSEQNKITTYCLSNKTSRNIGILISLYSGIRIGELCALQWKDIDFKKNTLKVNKTLQRIYIKDKEKNLSKVIITPPKTKNAKRIIPINKEFLDIIKTFKTNDNDYILKL